MKTGECLREMAALNIYHCGYNWNVTAKMMSFVYLIYYLKKISKCQFFMWTSLHIIFNEPLNRR